MTDTSDDIAQLIAEAERLEYGPARTALCQQAADLADARQDDERGFVARLALTSAACFGGQPDVLLVAFAWLLAKFDADPDRFGGFQRQYQVLWRYKWAISRMVGFPQFGLDQIKETFDDMRRRYEAAGASLNAVYNQEADLGVEMGDRSRAARGYAQMDRTPRDMLSDCAACVQDGRIDYQQLLGQPEQAVAAAEPILVGQMKCATVPQRTYAKLLRPLFELGRLEEAMAYHRKGYPLTANNPGLLGSAIRHIEFTVLTDNLSRAVRLAEKHLPVAVADPDPLGRLRAYTAFRFLFDVLRDSGKAAIKFRLPPGLSLKAETGTVPTADLFAWFDQEARQLAAAFDARNGNRYRTDVIDDQARLKTTITHHPFTRRRSS
jgi:hypothetical protein